MDETIFLISIQKSITNPLTEKIKQFNIAITHTTNQKNTSMKQNSNMSSKNYYEILGLPRDCKDTEIKQAYHKAAIKTHPDKNPDNPNANEDFKLARTSPPDINPNQLLISPLGQ